MRCQCGFENAGDARFCLACGNPIAKGTAAPVPPPVAVSQLPAPATGIRKYSTPIGIAVAIAAVLVYQFFLKADPERDGKRAAASYCDCTVGDNDAVIRMAEEFIKNFPSSKFARRADASAKFDEMRASLSRASTECRIKADSQLNELRHRYATDQERLTEFNFALTAQQGACFPENGPRTDAVGVEAQNLINSIKDPEPDLDQIKADLIGKQIPAWKFEFLNEIKGGKIQDVARAANRIEYRVLFNLHKATTNSDHDAEVMVAYSLEPQGWAFNSVRELWFTWDNLIASERWTTITPLQNHSFNISDDKKLLWKTSDFGREIRSGPDAPGVQLPGSSRYLIRSREGMPVIVRFTYRPSGGS
jgi:hypothetical protein